MLILHVQTVTFILNSLEFPGFYDIFRSKHLMYVQCKQLTGSYVAQKVQDRIIRTERLKVVAFKLYFHTSSK